MIKPEEVWLAYKSLSVHTRTTSQGRKVLTVTGKKYGLRGGFKQEFLNNMTSPYVEKLLCQAAWFSTHGELWKLLWPISSNLRVSVYLEHLTP